MTIHNLYIFDRHCQCIYYQKWRHHKASGTGSGSTQSASQSGSGSRLGFTTQSSRLSNSSPASSSGGDHTTSNPSISHSDDRLQSRTQPSGLAAGSVISIEEEAKLVYGVILSLRNFVRKLSPGNDDGFISYRTSTYRLHFYETPTGLKFVMNSDPNTENLRAVLKQIYVQLYVEFVVKNGLMRFDDTRWEISPGFFSAYDHDTAHAHTVASATTVSVGTGPTSTVSQAMPLRGTISNELFRIAVDRFIRSLPSFE